MEIKFFSAGCGDCIHLRFMGEDQKFHNILIDGGTEKGNIYSGTLHEQINAIIERKEIIDLWVISHIDDDHIGGILRFIKDTELIKQLDLSNTQFWFNYSKWDYDTGLKENNLKSVKQGITLREYLEANTILSPKITNELATVNFYGLKMFILSPDAANFNTLITKWEKEETKIVEKRESSLKMAQKNDYGIKVENFENANWTEDKSEENGSSIAFLMEYNDKKYLFLSDSYPSVIIKAIKNLGYSEEQGKKLSLEFMQVSHHGSKFNTNNELLQLIDCKNFIFSAEGINKHNVPNKETLVRILKNNPDRVVHFFITHKSEQTSSIFRVDGNLQNVSLEFPKSHENALIFNY